MATSSWLEQVRSAGKLFFRGLIELLYPNVCWICGQSIPEEVNGFCAKCRADLVTDHHATCPRCAGTVGPFVELNGGCVHCRDDKFAFDQVIRLGPYEGLLRETILRLKNRHGEALAEKIGQLWAEEAGEKVRALRADVVVPVPLHWRRKFWRGYNQSQTLARELARRLRLPFRPGWLRRIRVTPAQAGQTGGSVRRDNVRGAFRARGNLSLDGKVVLLVDDVLTTGSTAHEAARALRSAGPARIVVAVLARATPGR